MSANRLTTAIVRFLNFNGFVAWNVYNGGVYDPRRQTYRKNPTQKHGVFDICGFRKSDGRHLEIEIKWGRDKMSDHQTRHFDDLKSAGAICFVARDFDSFDTWFKMGCPPVDLDDLNVITKPKPNRGGFGSAL